MGAISSRNTCCDTLGSLYGHGEIGFVSGAIALYHQWQI
jgi:hypothetical protein